MVSWICNQMAKDKSDDWQTVEAIEVLLRTTTATLPEALRRE